MFSRKGMLILMMAVACAGTQSKPATPWRVEVVTSGGFAGRGIGTVAIDSQRNVSVTTIAGKSCSNHATDEEFANVEKLLGRSKPSQWGNYIPENKCCDRIESTLTFDEAGQKFVAQWITDPLPMPADLAKVSEAMEGLRQKYAEPCK
jgi:hypothetical protein